MCWSGRVMEARAGPEPPGGHPMCVLHVHLHSGVFGLGLSPLEAILCVFCMSIFIQVFLDPPAAHLNYVRPLLLHVNALQFTLFCDKSREFHHVINANYNLLLLLL
ncbi:hypothetical protein GOP47_0002392 [Adiantum capillus-veneris]|uniref:Uncharacterized protein n=1 Tax=Adiantum capillus-veneris TaxID=13818 RepID=A0A9D4VAA2_ADICA|nr:hypothetical protein GOP47_0002392 [Adiantum capillus-veneris]